MAHTLTSAVLEQPQTAANYLAWVERLIEQFKSDDADGLRQIRLKIGLAKKRMEEAFPVGLFASKYFEGSAEVKIALKVGSQNYDAIVRDERERPSGIKYIEVTTASEADGADYFRMLTLHEKGQASGLGQVSKTGTKNTGQVISIGPGFLQQEVLAKERQIISKAIERKLARNYPAHTALLIAFDDVMTHDRADNIANIEAALDGFGERLHVFQLVAIVGTKMGLLISRAGNAANT